VKYTFLGRWAKNPNIVIEYRAADGQIERFPALAKPRHNFVSVCGE
jgi:hypothetical protein